MEIGQLFINLGVKGTEKTLGAFTNVKKGLSDTASISLEAKAGIIGAMYALERLFSASGKTGTGLSQFNALTGESTKTLQQYQYAARQVGVSNEEVTGSFKSLQSVMTKTLMGQGAPSGLARVSQLTGGITPQDIDKFSKNPELLIQKLQQYAQKEKNIGLRNETLKSFGLSEGIIAGLSKNAFNAPTLNKAPTYSDKEIGKLNQANIAWSNLGNTIEMAVGKFNAKHGASLVGDISKLVPQVLKLVEAFVKLAETLKIFEGIGKVFEGWTKIFQGAGGAVDKLTTEKGRGEAAGDAADFFKGIPGVLKEIGKDILPGSSEGIKNNIAPTLGKSNVGNGNSQNNDIVINNNFQHPGTDHQKTGDSVKRAVQQGFRQLAAQSQAT